MLDSALCDGERRRRDPSAKRRRCLCVLDTVVRTVDGDAVVVANERYEAMLRAVMWCAARLFSSLLTRRRGERAGTTRVT